MELKIYSIKGWCSLVRHSFIIDYCNGYQIDLDEIVTNATSIQIYPDRCNLNQQVEDDGEYNMISKFKKRHYYKQYDSTIGFTIGEIFNLIVKTYWTMVKEIYNNDKDYISNLSLHTFYFDPKSNNIYADTDS